MPPRLTFGVEFEFALALHDETRALQGDPEPQLPQPLTLLPTSRPSSSAPKAASRTSNAIFELITDKMLAAGLPTRSMTMEWGSDSSQSKSSVDSDHFQDDGIGWIPSRQRQREYGNIMDDVNEMAETSAGVVAEAEAEDDGESEAQELEPYDEFGNQWMVTEDVTIRATRPQDYVWHEIEVQSPPYIFCEDSLQAVKLACKVITNEFRVETNGTTGLHVHIGDGADGYALRIIKNLMAFLWTFEPQIDQLHPNRRARLSSGEKYTWYESLRRGSILSEQLSPNGSYPIKILDGLKLIHAADDIKALDKLMAPNRKKSAYEISHLSYSDTIKRTVEFRQHEGTMNGPHVGEWIKTLVSLMEWIMDVDTTTLFEFLQAAADFEDRCWPPDEQPPYDIIDLFNDVGLIDRAAYWDGAFPPGVRNKPTGYYKRPRKPRWPLDGSVGIAPTAASASSTDSDGGDDDDVVAIGSRDDWDLARRLREGLERGGGRSRDELGDEGISDEGSVN